MSAERRAAERTRFSGGVLPPAARVLPGRDVIVVDLSRDGALVEGVWRLRPGSRVDLQLGTVSDERVLRGRIERCYVASMTSTTVRYRAAIRFERPVSVMRPPNLLDGYAVPGASRDISQPPGHALPGGRAVAGGVVRRPQER